MRHFAARIRVVLLFAFVPQVASPHGVLAQGPQLQQGSKAQVVLLDPDVAPFDGSVTQIWDDGFEIDVRGESGPRRVDFAEVESLERSLRLGNKARRGAVYGGAILGTTGFLFGYCFQLFSDECANDFEAGMQVGLPAAGIGALIGAGIGLMISHYGPWETVADLGAPGRSGAQNRVSINLLPYPDGRIALGVTLRGR